jgi:hypothetical protein
LAQDRARLRSLQKTQCPLNGGSQSPAGAQTANLGFDGPGIGLLAQGFNTQIASTS